MHCCTYKSQQKSHNVAQNDGQAIIFTKILKSKQFRGNNLDDKKLCLRSRMQLLIFFTSVK
jgi:hypothetical protein